MTARNAVFAASDHVRRLRGHVSVFRGPAVSETGVVFDLVETGVNIAELLANTLDEGAYVGPIPFRAVPCDEILAVDKIIDFTVTDVLARFVRQQGQDPEFRQGAIDRASGPQRAICVKTQH